MVGALHVLWFCHQPFFVPDDEVVWRVNSSYRPIVDAFRDRSLPMSLGITGGLLERIADLVPYFLDELRQAIEDGQLTLIGTAAHHPVLPWLSTNSAHAQISEDQRIRKKLDLPSFPLFWPTELAWSMRVGYLAAEAGYSAVVVDRRSCDLSNLMPVWNRVDGQLTPERRLVDRTNRHSLMTLPIELKGGSHELEIWARDSEIARSLVNVMHGQEDDERSQFATFLNTLRSSHAKASNANAPLLLGEDVERIMPNGFARLLDLLDALVQQGVELHSATSFRKSHQKTSLPYIPAGTMEGDDRLWSEDTDNRWFREHLDRVSHQFEHRYAFDQIADDTEIEWFKRLLKIQDSSFYFWRYISRTRGPFYRELSNIETWLSNNGGPCG